MRRRVRRGRFPTILSGRPTTSTDALHRDFRLLHAAGSPSCTSTSATATAPRGRARTTTLQRARRQRRIRHRRVDRRAAVVERPSAPSEARSRAVQIRPALERPPHLTAIWPDVVTTNNYPNCTREGGAMQGHMFWALFIHAQDAQEVATSRALGAGLGRPPEHPRALQATPWQPGRRRSACPDARAEADRLLRAAPTTTCGRASSTIHRYFDRHADVPMTVSSGWFDP